MNVWERYLEEQRHAWKEMGIKPAITKPQTENENPTPVAKPNMENNRIPTLPKPNTESQILTVLKPNMESQTKNVEKSLQLPNATILDIVKNAPFATSSFSWTKLSVESQKELHPVAYARATMSDTVTVGKRVLFRIVPGDVAYCRLCKGNVVAPLKDHLRKVHADAGQCRTCGYIVVDGKRGMSFHRRRFHREVYVCKTCTFTCLKKADFEMHKTRRLHINCQNAITQAYNELIARGLLTGKEKMAEEELPYVGASHREIRRLKKVKEEIEAESSEEIDRDAQDIDEMARMLEDLVGEV